MARKNKSGKSRRVHDVCRETIRVRLTDPSAGSAIGLTVFDRYEIDTQLGTLLGELANVFEMWRLHRLSVHFVPILGSTALGWCGMTYLPDPEDTTPASGSSALSAKYAIAKPIADINGYVFTIPPGLSKGWLYTKDIVVQADRWESFGDLVFFSSAMNTASVPGILYAVLDVSFRSPINSGIGAIRSRIGEVEDLPTEVKGTLVEQPKSQSNATKGNIKTPRGFRL